MSYMSGAWHAWPEYITRMNGRAWSCRIRYVDGNVRVRAAADAYVEQYHDTRSFTSTNLQRAIRDISILKCIAGLQPNQLTFTHIC
jgi:hypothetical protein